MPCYKPLKGFHGPSGITFDKNQSFGYSPIDIPCGRCIGCRLDKARDWALRCHHEASLYDSGLNNSFITLTYANEHLPKHDSLNKTHFRKFIRALRKKTQQKIRYYMCGEYGKATPENQMIARPHYHAILFGFTFPELTLVNIRNKNRVYTSPLLLKLWKYGTHEIGSVTFQSAGYVARYILKKQNGEHAEREYGIPNPETGEISDQQKIHPYTSMSLHPGIGKKWYEQNKGDLFPHDYAVAPNGRKVPVPNYYRRLLEKEDPELYAELKKIRIEKCIDTFDNTPERLEVREFCKTKQADRLLRHL